MRHTVVNGCHGGAVQEVCRCLGVDLRGQTSASFNMRQNYERCLFEFEDYLSTGAYVADINAGRAPSADAILPFQPRHPIAALPVPGVAPTRHTPVPPRAATPPERTVTTRGGLLSHMKPFSRVALRVLSHRVMRCAIP